MKSETWSDVLRPASAALNTREFLLLQLIYRHGLTQAAIARRLDVPLKSVSSAVAVALRKLAPELERPRPRLSLLDPVAEVA